MTSSALSIYESQKKYQVEEGTFSETAILNGSVNIEGVFDDPNTPILKDSGHVAAQGSKPRFIVKSRPADIVAKTSTLVVRSENYIIMRVDAPDTQGILSLWLQKK